MVYIYAVYVYSIALLIYIYNTVLTVCSANEYIRMYIIMGACKFNYCRYIYKQQQQFYLYREFRLAEL